MKRIVLFAFSAFVSMLLAAQSGVVSMREAARIFKQKSSVAVRGSLLKLGYVYKGVSSDSYGKCYNYVRNMDLTASFLPTRFSKGTSSYVMFSVDGSALYIYVFNKAVFKELASEVKALGYDMGSGVKSGAGPMVCTLDGEPTFTFLTLHQPLPYCVQITE